MIHAGGRELMSSGAHGSEEELARLGCAACRGLPAPRVLVGGLGLGYTTRAALELLPPGAELLVAEVLPEVVVWNRGPLAHLAGRPLDDRRVRVVESDVARLLGECASFEAILLDVDNGPDGLSRPANARLYEEDGLGAARRALSPGGTLAIWSSSPVEDFPRRLERAGFVAVTHEVPARSGLDDEMFFHTLYVAT